MTSSASLESIVRTLARFEVRFVLIGGLAVSAHGHVRATKDADVCFEQNLENGERMSAALEELGAEVVAADLPTPPEGITAAWLCEGDQFVFATEKGYLDALARTSVGTYEDLEPRAEGEALSDGTEIMLIAYEDLVRAKEAAGRPQDVADLEALRAVREDRR